ncbi:MAG: cytochrome c-type biogenesis protein CcmH [Anaerolineae bacterium]
MKNAPFIDVPVWRSALHLLKVLFFILVLGVWAALPINAQEATRIPVTPVTPVTDDDVNRLANRLYCPVCPNETLDACRTEACAQWRAEIRAQLETGATDQQVIDHFIARFGQRVIGSPQDPALQALAIGAPIVIAGIALGLGVVTFLRWRQRRPAEASVLPAANSVDDDYRARMEQDLR